MEVRVLEKLQQQILDGIKRILAHQVQIINILDIIQYKTSNIEEKIDDNNQILKMLMYKYDELDAKSDCLLQTTATRDSIKKLHAKYDLL